MANPYNGSRTGKRGGQVYRASRLHDRILDTRPAAVRKAHPLHQAQSAPSTWSATENQAKGWQCAVDVEESTDTHGIHGIKRSVIGNRPLVRQSITQAQHLEARGQQLEFSNLRERKIVKRWNGFKACWEPVFNADGSPCWVKGVPEADGWIENPRRLEWKSDRTLLRQGVPDPESKKIKVQAHGSKLIVTERIDPICVEVPIIDADEIDALNLDAD